MAAGPFETALRYLRRRAALEIGGPTDAELLARFLDRRDESAFELIVARHGPLVWALCRGALPAADAEDAFQAAFVVLAMRAGRIHEPASLGQWLSGVTRLVVRKQRARLGRRRTVSLDGVTAVAKGEPDAEWREVLDEEVRRLPESCRLPVMLCYAQGFTNAEAAKRLGWPVGSVAGRLGGCHAAVSVGGQNRYPVRGDVETDSAVP